MRTKLRVRLTAIMLVIMTSLPLAVNAAKEDLPADGLAGYWDLDSAASENLKCDGWGDPVVGDSVTEYADSSRKALKFDGTANSYINMGPVTDKSAWNGATVSAWINPSSPNWEKSILALSDASGDMKMSLYLLDNYLSVAIGGQWRTHYGPKINDWTFGHWIPFNEWQHVAVTYKPYADDGKTQINELKIYRNGSLLSEYTANLDIDSSNALYLNLGGRLTKEATGTTKADNTYSGMIDNVAVYKRGLSADEITELYMEENPKIVNGEDDSIRMKTYLNISDDDNSFTVACKTGFSDNITAANCHFGNLNGNSLTASQIERIDENTLKVTAAFASLQQAVSEDTTFDFWLDGNITAGKKGASNKIKVKVKASQRANLVYSTQDDGEQVKFIGELQNATAQTMNSAEVIIAGFAGNKMVSFGTEKFSNIPVLTNVSYEITLPKNGAECWRIYVWDKQMSPDSAGGGDSLCAAAAIE